MRRGSDEFIGHGQNPHFKVFALNLPKNQLTQLTEDALDILFVRLVEEFGVKPEDCPIFYLYDRDVYSYKNNELKGKYVKKYTDPYGTENGDQGQLLLSYPAIESYLLSCIEDDAYNMSFLLGRDLKGVLANKIDPNNYEDKTDLHLKTIDLVFSNDKIEAEKRLIHSIDEMNNGLEFIGISEYDLDNLAPTLLEVYDCQQKKYKEKNVFSLISLVGMALLELGIIIESDEVS
ncbi:hypothetical protein SAMN04487934_10119 [Eubacterium ruminantium]|nr:hypothetical protein SAMN04487934_10119 [Eubacterium ruminantium]